MFPILVDLLDSMQPVCPYSPFCSWISRTTLVQTKKSLHISMCCFAPLSVNCNFVPLWACYWDMYWLHLDGKYSGISVFAITEFGRGILCGLWASRNRVKNEVWEPLRTCRISALYFLIKCVAAWLSHKSWPAHELTLTNVCCYQKGEEFQKVNVPCKVQIFQSLGHIIHPWIAGQTQTPPEWLYYSSCYHSSQAHLEFVSYPVGWVDHSQELSPLPVTRLLPSWMDGGQLEGKRQENWWVEIKAV